MSNGTNETVNREYKDRLFNFIFGREENRKWTLSLYNAINGSEHKDPDEIEFNTLEDFLYLGMKNDTSFLIEDIISVYEHQSSFNPNMPLRMLGYISSLYSGYIKRKKYNKYGERLIELPTPKLVVFYNGEKNKDDKIILKLTDSFAESQRDDSDIEVRVRMLNINFGRNACIMKKCKPLSEYAWFVERIRERIRKEKQSSGSKNPNLVEAVKQAIDGMPDDFEIKSFLVAHREEVEGMLDTEYNEAEVREQFMEDGRREGRNEERSDLIASMLRRGKTVEEIAEFCGYPYEQVKQVEDALLTPSN